MSSTKAQNPAVFVLREYCRVLNEFDLIYFSVTVIIKDLPESLFRERQMQDVQLSCQREVW